MIWISEAMLRFGLLQRPQLGYDGCRGLGGGVINASVGRFSVGLIDNLNGINCKIKNKM